MEWALRDYKVDGQIGNEKTIDEYVTNLINVFNECKRVLKKEGTCWVILGDTYSQESIRIRKSCANTTRRGGDYYNNAVNNDTEQKSLCLIPERFALKMIENKWILRNKIIWYKPNCMPSSAKDRFTVDYEYVYFFTKSQKYYFKTQYEPLSEVTIKEVQRFYNGKGIKDYEGNGVQNPSDVKRSIIKKFAPIGGIKHVNGDSNNNRTYSGNEYNPNLEQGRIKRCVWKINTKPFPEAHFAVFPPELVKQCLDAGCPSEVCKKCEKPKVIERVQETPKWERKLNENRDSNRLIGQKYQNWLQEHPPIENIISCNCNAGFYSGIVLDPFMGSGTVALVALKSHKQFLGIELNSSYIEIANKRLEPLLKQQKLEKFDII